VRFNPAFGCCADQTVVIIQTGADMAACAAERICKALKRPYKRGEMQQAAEFSIIQLMESRGGARP
jgi:nitrogenase subunit NifH